jgi:universal stress protein A
MKFKPINPSGGLVVELSPKEAQLPAASTPPATAPLPIFRLKNILVPVDFSDCSKKALQYAIPLARQFGAEITLLHVVQPYLPVPETGAVDVELVQVTMRDEGEKELEALRQGLAGVVPSRTVLRVGNPHVEIIDVAKQLESDLIIVSTHGRTGLAHVFLGSTAERVVRHAGCPVLVVREREREFVNDPS